MTIEAQHLQNLMNITSDMFMITNLDLSITKVNECWEKTTGFFENEMQGRQITEYLSDDEKEYLVKKLQSHKYEKSFTFDSEFSFFNKHGIEKTFHWKVSKKDPFYYMIIKDITVTREEIEFMQDQEKLIRIGQIASGIGHEISNPLTVVIGTARVLNKKIHKAYGETEFFSNEFDSFITKHTRAVDEITDIVNGLRSFSKIHTDEVCETNVNSAVLETIAVIMNQFRKHNITLELDQVISGVNGDVNLISAANGKFQHLLLNLLLIAKDKLAGQKDARIKINVKKHLDCIITSILINDSDSPQKEEISKAAKLGGGHIEDYQADIRSSFSIVHELGGHLDIAEHKEHGTSYIVNVPVYVKIDPKTVLKLESPPKVATMKTEINDVIQDDNIRVLLVEDESGIREILKDILEDNEINVDGASNGLDALNLLKEDKVYDLIFLDLRMPVMDGVEFIHKLYEMQFKQEARIYIITGGLEFSNEEKLIVKKVDGILQKPFNPDDLMDIIEQYRKSKHGKILFTALEKDII